MTANNASTGGGHDPRKKKEDADAAASVSSEDGDTADVVEPSDLINAEDADVESLTPEEISFIEAGERELLADMRNDLARAQAELVNFRKRRHCRGHSHDASRGRRPRPRRSAR